MNLKLSEQVKKCNYETIYCPMDGGKIPIVLKEKDTKGTNFMFTWCHYCGLAFGYIGRIESHYQLVASFYWNEELFKVGVWAQHLNNDFLDSKYPFSSNGNDLSTLVRLAFGIKGLEIFEPDILTLKLFADEVFGFLNAT